MNLDTFAPLAGKALEVIQNFSQETLQDLLRGADMMYAKAYHVMETLYYEYFIHRASFNEESTLLCQTHVGESCSAIDFLLVADCLLILGVMLPALFL